MTQAKPFWQSKTVWINAVAIFAAILESTEIVDLIPADWQAAIPALLAVANIILRTVTHQPVSVRSEQ